MATLPASRRFQPTGPAQTIDLRSKVEIGLSPPADELLRKSTRAESRRLRTRTTPLGGSLPVGLRDAHFKCAKSCFQSIPTVVVPYAPVISKGTIRVEPRFLNSGVIALSTSALKPDVVSERWPRVSSVPCRSTRWFKRLYVPCTAESAPGT